MKTTRKAECPHCKGTDFYIHEFQYWKAATDSGDPTKINAYTVKGSGIDLIECANKSCPGSAEGFFTDITHIIDEFEVIYD